MLSLSVKHKGWEILERTFTLSFLSGGGGVLCVCVGWRVGAGARIAAEGIYIYNVILVGNIYFHSDAMPHQCPRGWAGG